MDRDTRQLRAAMTEFQTRQDGDVPHISGYFAVFDSVYQIGPGMSESIAPGAFTNTLSGDIRALTNHDSTLVLGRNTAGTLELRQDEHGLCGDAMNSWARVDRRDVTQCSLGFRIISENTAVREDGSEHWTILEVELFEVSICTFPAYQETNVSARSHQRDEIRNRALTAWKEQTKQRLQGA